MDFTERRVHDRTKRRMPCELVIEGRRQRGIVLDLSPTGLFVQTSAKPPKGGHLGVEMTVDGERLVLEARVVRKRVVPPQLLSAAAGGLGLRIVSAPASYFDFLARIGRTPEARAAPRPRGGPETAPEPEAEPEPAARFRVRLGQVGGSRTRTLEVEAADEHAARKLALAEAGSEWKVLQLDWL